MEGISLRFRRKNDNSFCFTDRAMMYWGSKELILRVWNDHNGSSKSLYKKIQKKEQKLCVGVKLKDV